MTMPQKFPVWRSALFVPANVERFVAKAIPRGADALIIDLEDSIPLAQKKFLLDPSNLAVTSTALGIGVLGAAAIEATWWIRARMLGIEPRLWRSPAD